jgi:hypothetical protein
VHVQMKNISASEDQLEPEGLAELSAKVCMPQFGRSNRSW